MNKSVNRCKRKKNGNTKVNVYDLCAKQELFVTIKNRSASFLIWFIFMNHTTRKIKTIILKAPKKRVPTKIEILGFAIVYLDIWSHTKWFNGNVILLLSLAMLLVFCWLLLYANDIIFWLAPVKFDINFKWFVFMIIFSWLNKQKSYLSYILFFLSVSFGLVIMCVCTMNLLITTHSMLSKKKRKTKWNRLIGLIYHRNTTMFDWTIVRDDSLHFLCSHFSFICFTLNFITWTNLTKKYQES